MWDERYSGKDYAYGTAPNDFLREMVSALPSGRVLCLADGEGRNGVFLAEQGFAVTSVDQSASGMRKARELAASRGVAIETVVADLSEWEMGEGRWDAIVSIFAHMPPAVRGPLHRRVVRALRPGGVFLLEAYTPDQLNTTGTGGPAQAAMMMTLPGLKSELEGLDVLTGVELRRSVDEGKFHSGEGAVVRFLARKPE